MPISTKQAAKLLGIHEKSVARAARLKILKATKLGRDYLIYPADLEAYALNHPRPSRVQPIRIS
jgi:excisionase family DNA binding protein